MPGEFDMGRMQEEAVRRAREMQSRARLPLQHPGRNRGQAPAPEPAPPRRQQSPAEPPPEPPQAPAVPVEPAVPQPQESQVSGGMLESLFQDKERTIILALLILLSGEDGNHELMFALLFLLL